jgi:hypothetical protein
MTRLLPIIISDPMLGFTKDPHRTSESESILLSVLTMLDTRLDASCVVDPENLMKSYQVDHGREKGISRIVSPLNMWLVITLIN